MRFFVGQWVVPRRTSNSPLRADGLLPNAPGQVVGVDKVDGYLYVDFGVWGVLLVTPDEVTTKTSEQRNPLR